MKGKSQDKHLGGLNREPPVQVKGQRTPVQTFKKKTFINK